MDVETRNCQNCKNQFNVEPEDFGFYEKMQVPPPTFCPECRFQRRIMFRQERTLYKRSCDLCKKEVVSIHAPDTKMVVYCSHCWYSDKWDDGAFYLDYDPKRNFFEQMMELHQKAPYSAMIHDYTTLVNSEYVNYAGSLKNCYLIFNADFNENVHYSTVVVRNKDSMDSLMLSESELCYENICSGKSFRLFFSEDSSNCRDSYFLKSCTDCSDCYGCVNLRNKQYHIFNESYTKEEYVAKLKEFKINTYSGLMRAREQARAFWLEYPRKYMHALMNANATGDYVFQSKNAINCYQTKGIEDARYCQFLTMGPAKDIYDVTEWGNGIELVVDSVSAGEGTSMVRFCNCACQGDTLDMEYCMYNLRCKHNFGCINLKGKEYRILNKQYSPEEYKKMRAEIIQSMNDRPYVDSSGRVWKYGEFLPYDLSPWAYNETQAQQYFPLTKEEILKKGWRWREPVPSQHKVTLPPEKLPDSIRDLQDSILQEVLGCAKCSKPFKMIPAELALLRRFEFPIPRLCPDCRHMERLSRLNPPKLWDRNCAKCNAAFQTAYAPDRPEIIYCESCYQKEVV